MRLSDKKMPLPLSGKMSVILPFILFLAPFGLFVISAMHRDPEECFGSFVVGQVCTVPLCCAIAFARTDKTAISVFSFAVIALAILSCSFR